MPIDLRDENGQPIFDWRRWVLPASPDGHWKPGRSAMGLARAWFTSPAPQIPPEIAELLASSPKTGQIVLERGEPEKKTKLPASHRGDRNHDLWLTGHGTDFSATVCVEAKADEKFDDLVGKIHDQKSKVSSDIPARIEAMLRLVFGPQAVLQPYRNLRYQLLTAAAGTLIQADIDQSSVAVLIVHEFQTTETDSKPLARNAADLQNFIDALPIASVPVQAGRMLGPIHYEQQEHLLRAVEFYIGKAVYVW